jgi:hypothetical protein
MQNISGVVSSNRYRIFETKEYLERLSQPETPAVGLVGDMGAARTLNVHGPLFTLVISYGEPSGQCACQILPWI